MNDRNRPHPWGQLPSDPSWFDTLDTLHLWTQIVGKLRMARSPWINHSWSVPLYVSPTGLRTSTVPYDNEAFELTFDFGDSELVLVTSTGLRRTISLEPKTVAAFYDEVLDMMASVDMPISIHTTPNEIADAIPFPDDTTHASYDPDHARLLFRALLDTERVLTWFRAGYIGKVSPVHFFWGSFDLAVTRFSGRLAPPHPGGGPNFPDDVAREAYSHEVTSCGFWPGNAQAPTPIFYAYAYPTPDGFSASQVEPSAASWLDELGEFALPYSAVAEADDPEAMLLSFCESTHAAAADLAGWDRARLECTTFHGPTWWRDRPPGGHEQDVTDRPITYRHDPDEHSYVAEAGGTAIGKAVYHERNGRYLFVHTEIDSDFEGKGIASALVRYALDDVGAKSAPVVALCPYVAGWVERHPDYAELLAEPAI